MILILIWRRWPSTLSFKDRSVRAHGRYPNTPSAFPYKGLSELALTLTNQYIHMIFEHFEIDAEKACLNYRSICFFKYTWTMISLFSLCLFSGPQWHHWGGGASSSTSTLKFWALSRNKSQNKTYIITFMLLVSEGTIHYRTNWLLVKRLPTITMFPPWPPVNSCSFITCISVWLLFLYGAYLSTLTRLWTRVRGAQCNYTATTEPKWIWSWNSDWYWGPGLQENNVYIMADIQTKE